MIYRNRATCCLLALVAAVVVGRLAAQEAKTEPKAEAKAEAKNPVSSTVNETAAGTGESAKVEAAATLERPSDPQAVAVVEQYLKAIGGRELLAAIKDRIMSFRNIKYSATGETTAKIALYIKEGYKFREEWEILGFKIKDEPLAFVQIYNGELLQGWVQMLGTVSTLEGRTLGVFVWDKYLDDFFAHWKENGYSLKMVGDGLVDDDPAHIVEVSDFTGRQKLRYFFSKTTGLLTKKEWFDTTQKSTVKKEQFYRRYRPIAFQDGSGNALKVALRLEIRVDGDLDTERQYDEVKFNSNLSDALFERPEGEEFTSPITSSDAARARKKLEESGATGDSESSHGRRRRAHPRITRELPESPEAPAPKEAPAEPESKK
jgi:hypothetical protein